MSDPAFNKHLAKVYLTQAISQTRFPGWHAWLINKAGEKRREYLQYLRSKREIQLELF